MIMGRTIWGGGDTSAIWIAANEEGHVISLNKFNGWRRTKRGNKREEERQATCLQLSNPAAPECKSPGCLHCFPYFPMPTWSPSPALASQGSRTDFEFPLLGSKVCFKMFRLFGNLWLDDPPENVLATLNGILPLIQNFEQNTAQGKYPFKCLDIAQ